MNKLLIGGAIVVLLVLIGIGAVWAFSDKVYAPAPPGGPSETVGTTTPTPNPTAETESTVAGLNQRIYQFGVHITPLEVVEDSRCPMGVYCIQAGTVRLKAKLEDSTHSEVVTFVQGSPVAFGNKHVALMSVTPPKSQNKPIAPADYRFTFSVAYGMGGDAAASGTLAGTMTIGPVCPVERIDNPCKPTPEMFAARKINVYAANKTTLITTITPGADGTFSTPLSPGTYYVAMAQATSGSGGATGLPATVTIKSGATVHLTVDVDTGIR